MNYGKGGYQKAYDHYKRLKEQFYKQLELTTEKNTQMNLKAFQNKLEQQLVNTSLQSDTEKSASQIINSIFNNLGEQFDKTTDVNIQEWIKKSINTLNKAEYNSKKLTEKEKTALNQALTTNIVNSGIDFRKMLLKQIKKETGSMSTQRYSAILSQTNTFLITYLKAKIQGLQKYELYGWPMKRLAGFLNEDLAYKGLKQIFQGTNMNVRSGGTRKGPTGRMIEMDNIISAVGGLSGLNKQLSVTYSTDQFLENYDKNISLIQYFGEQVKSFNFGNLTIRSRERIADREELKKAYLASNYDFLLSPLNNRDFMSSYKNILTTFRPDTLFFTTRDKKMFMDEFIKQFRQQKFLLQLEWATQSKEDQTSYLQEKKSFKQIIINRIVLVHESSEI